MMRLPLNAKSKCRCVYRLYSFSGSLFKSETSAENVLTSGGGVLEQGSCVRDQWGQRRTFVGDFVRVGNLSYHAPHWQLIDDDLVPEEVSDAAAAVAAKS